MMQFFPERSRQTICDSTSAHTPWLCRIWWERMNSVFAGLFVFASAVFGDNKGRIASEISVAFDILEATFDTAVYLKLVFV